MAAAFARMMGRFFFEPMLARARDEALAAGVPQVSTHPPRQINAPDGEPGTRRQNGNPDPPDADHRVFDPHPFYFLKAGSPVEAHAVAASIGLITVFLAIKMATKFIGILPLTRYHEFDRREGMYTSLLMSTGLTFGSISALFGLTNKIIDQTQHTILVTAVIGSAVVPTLIAQTWLQPEFKAIADEPEVLEAEDAAREEP